MVDLLLIDNYDSFTYNLVHYLTEVGANCQVVRNDQITTAQILSKKPKAVVISPGPSDPDKAGICLDFIKKSAGRIPILGVCLGHQAIAQAYGSEIIKTKPMHGKISTITNTGEGLFKNTPPEFDVTRYHSLVISPHNLPNCFKITAHSQNLIMAIQHKKFNIHGVQFHPESIASQYGHQILHNFVDLCRG